MTRAEEQALKAYPECMVYNDLAMEYEDINGCYRVGFEVGYNQAKQDLWHNVKDEKPELRRTVICVNELVVEAELYTDDNELDEIEHYTKWCYLDDILPKD